MMVVVTTRLDPALEARIRSCACAWLLYLVRPLRVPCALPLARSYVGVDAAWDHQFALVGEVCWTICCRHHPSTICNLGTRPGRDGFKAGFKAGFKEPSSWSPSRHASIEYAW